MLRAFRIAAATNCFAQPLKSAIQTAGEIGASGLQLDALNEIRQQEFTESARRQFLHRLGELGMSVASLNVPLRRALYDRDNLDARLDAVKQAMSFAWQLKSRVVTARVGSLPDAGDSADRETLVAVLNDLARHGNHVGAVFSLTTSGDSAETLAELLAEVDQGPLGVHLDPAVLVTSGRNPVDYITRFRDVVSQIQIRDAVRDIDGAALETPVGRGEVVWDELLALAYEAEFQGWLTVDRRSGDDRISDMARAVKFVRNLLPG